MVKLLLDDFQNFHGADLHADTAGNALGSRILGFQDHNLHGTDLDTLAAADALLLIDHVNTGLGILGNCLMLTGLHALAALNAGHGLCSISLGYDLNAAQVLMEFLIECIGAGTNALQASHALGVFLNSEFLHNRKFSFSFFFSKYYT